MYLINPYRFVSLASPVTWNPLDKNAGITLSNSNLTATRSPAGPGSVRGTSSKSSGIWQFEVTNFSGQWGAVGLGTSGSNIAEYPGAGPLSWGFQLFNGTKANGGSNSAYSSGSTTGSDVLGVVWDATAGDIIFMKNGTSLGVAFSGISGALFPMWGQWFPSSACSGTLRTSLLYPYAGAALWA